MCMKPTIPIACFFVFWSATCVIGTQPREAAQLVTQAGSSQISCVAFSSEGRRFVVGRLDGVAVVWDLNSKLEIL